MTSNITICNPCLAIAETLGIDPDTSRDFVLERGDEISHECVRRSEPEASCECPCNRQPMSEV